jgi:hypothetical protein
MCHRFDCFLQIVSVYLLHIYMFFLFLSIYIEKANFMYSSSFPIAKRFDRLN